MLSSRYRVVDFQFDTAACQSVHGAYYLETKSFGRAFQALNSITILTYALLCEDVSGLRLCPDLPVILSAEERETVISIPTAGLDQPASSGLSPIHGHDTAWEKAAVVKSALLLQLRHCPIVST